MKIRSIIIAGLSLIQLLISLFVMWLTLGWKVRKTRKAFEKQLIRQGMTKRDAKRLSSQYSKLKNDVMNTLKGSIFRSR
jgi:hypothetical protein